MKILLSLFVLIGLFIALANPRSPLAPSPAPQTGTIVEGQFINTDPAKVEAERRREALNSLTIKNFNWTAEYGVMEASFTFVNPSDYDVKDMKVRCDHSAASGTVMDSNTRVIYEAVPARGSKSVRKFNMGFVSSQAKRSGCVVLDAVVGAHRPAPPPKAPQQPNAKNAPTTITPSGPK